MSVDPSPEREPAWASQDLANPHAAADKARRVRRMFAAIAPSYDLNNRVHSLGRDRAWRRRVVADADLQADDLVLDVACGTGDLAMAFAQAGARRVIGLDFTFDMLRLAHAKRKGPAKRVRYHAADAMRLPLADESVDVVSIAFGIRNVVDPARVAREFYRVLRPGGRAMILEFSLPINPLLRRAYQFYFNHVLPRTAAAIARDRTGAYRYLPASVNTFLSRGRLVEVLERAGFANVTLRPLTFGIAVCYRAVKT